jgi:hypothetical protein
MEHIQVDHALRMLASRLSLINYIRRLCLSPLFMSVCNCSYRSSNRYHLLIGIHRLSFVVTLFIPQTCIPRDMLICIGPI